MNVVTVLIGVAAILYGCYTLYVRSTDPSKFAKLEAMKRFWGESAGTTIHVLAYSLLPIAAGVAFVVAGTRGVSLF